MVKESKPSEKGHTITPYTVEVEAFEIEKVNLSEVPINKFDLVTRRGSASDRFTDGANLLDKVEKSDDKGGKVLAVSENLTIQYTEEDDIRFRVSQTEIDEITEEEAKIIAEAKENGTYLKAPNGKASKLSPKQWVQVRTSRFKEWFGDWELAAKVVKIINANAKHGLKNFAEARNWAKENILGTYINPEIGEVVISGKAVDKYLSGKATKQSQSIDAHLSALQVLPQLIENSIVGEVHEDRSLNENLKDIVRLFGAINIGDKISRVKITVKRYTDKNAHNKAYSYEVTEIEPLEGTLETTHALSADFVSSASNSSITGVKLLNGVENSKGLPILNSSKIVDENGDRNIAMIHRLGSLMYDELSDSYVPIKITVKEFTNEENKRIYSVEAIDIETQKKSAGQLVSDSKEKGQPRLLTLV